MRGRDPMEPLNVWVLSSEFEALFLIDSFESFLWTDEYCGAGDFEIYTTVDINMLDRVQKGYYIWIEQSDKTMIVETIQITTNVEEGSRLIISGRSLESILDRKIIWAQTNISGNLQNGVKRLLDENLMNPSIADRKIENFLFEESEDEKITNLTLEAQYTGDNLYDTICAICNANEIGFEVLMNDKNQFVFRLYAGQDRSYNQFKNPYIIFSPSFGNIISSKYIDSDKSLKNVALVAGEGEGIDRRTYVVGSASGMERRELYVDARDVQSKTDDGDKLSDKDYNEKLETRGKERLSEYEKTKTFEGDLEPLNTFVYGKDYFKGDIVQFVNEYNMEARVRVMEIVISQDTSGYKCYPTFSVIEEDENEGVK